MDWFTLFLACILVLWTSGSASLYTLALRFSFTQSKTLRREWRSTSYLWSILLTWLPVPLLAILCLNLHWSAPMLGLRPPAPIFLTGVFFAVFVLFILTLIIGQRWLVQNNLAGDSAAEYARKSRTGFLPRTTKERVLCAIMALTIGFCEELMYRGFLPLLVTSIFPHLPFGWALFVANLVFSVAHMNWIVGGCDRLVAVLGAGVMGFVFGFLYISVGSLFLPITLHALFDLRILLLRNADRLDKATPSKTSASLSL